MKHLLYLALVLIFVASSLACTGRSSFGDSGQLRTDAVTEEDLKECSSKMHSLITEGISSGKKVFLTPQAGN